jgi:hypothetical protein
LELIFEYDILLYKRKKYKCTGLIASQTYYKCSYISECTPNYHIIMATENI